MSDLVLNGLDKNYLVRARPTETTSGTSAQMTEALRLAGQAFGIRPEDVQIRTTDLTKRYTLANIRSRITELASVIYQLLPQDNKYKTSNGQNATENERRLANYLDAVTWDDEVNSYLNNDPEHDDHNNNNNDVPVIDAPLRRAMFAYGYLSFLIMNADNNALDNSARAAAYRTRDVTAHDMRSYNYDTILETAERLIQQDNTDLSQVERLLLFAIYGEARYPAGATAARAVFGNNSYESQYLNGYPGLDNNSNDYQAYDLLEQLVKLSVVAADNIFEDSRTLLAQPAQDTNNDRVLNVHDAYARSSADLATNRNWTARTPALIFNSARVASAWNYYTRAGDQCASTRAAIPANAANAQTNRLTARLNDYAQDITAKKRVLLQRFVTEARKIDNPHSAYTLLEASKNLPGAANSAYASDITAIKAEQKKLLDTAKSFYGLPQGIRLDLVSSYNQLSVSNQADIENALKALDSPDFIKYKDLFDAYYSGRLSDENGVRYAQASTLLSALRINSNQSVSDKWKELLLARQNTIAAEVQRLATERVRQEAEAAERLRQAEAAKAADQAILREAQENFASADSIYQNDVGLTALGAAAGSAATAADTAVNNFSDSSVEAALASAVAAAGQAGVNIQTIQNNRGLNPSQKIAEIAKLVKEDAERRKGETATATAKAAEASSYKTAAEAALRAASAADATEIEARRQSGLAEAAAKDAEAAARAAEEAALKAGSDKNAAARINASTPYTAGNPPSKADQEAQKARADAVAARAAANQAAALVDKARNSGNLRTAIDAFTDAAAIFNRIGAAGNGTAAAAAASAAGAADNAVIADYPDKLNAALEQAISAWRSAKNFSGSGLDNALSRDIPRYNTLNNEEKIKALAEQALRQAQEQEAAIQAERLQAERDKEKNIAALTQAQRDLAEARNIYTELGLTTLAKETSDAHNAAETAAREYTPGNFPDNLNGILREMDEAVTAAAIRRGADYTRKTSLDKTLSDAAQLKADAEKRKIADAEAHRQRELAEAARDRARDEIAGRTPAAAGTPPRALTPAEKRERVNQEARKAETAAAEAQKAANIAGNDDTQEEAARAREAAEETAAILENLEQTIEAQQELGRIVAQLGENIKAARDTYSELSPRPRLIIEALDRVQPAVNDQDTDQIVAIINREQRNWPDDVRTQLRAVLDSQDSSFKKAEELIKIINADAQARQNQADGSNPVILNPH